MFQGEFGCFRMFPVCPSCLNLGTTTMVEGMWQVGELGSQALLVTSGCWLPLCCLTGSRLLLEIQQQWRCWGRAGFWSKILLLPFTLRQTIVWGLRPDSFTTTELFGVAVDAKLPLPVLSCSTSLTCSNAPTFRLTPGSLRCVCVHSIGIFVGL